MCAGRRFKRSECLLSEPLYTAVTAVAFYLAAPHEFLISLIFFYFFVPFLRPSPYLLRQPPTIASAFPQKHRGSILFATKDPFQELFSDISLSVKHSSNPFSEFKSANKSHNPHLLPFCKSPPPQFGVSGALCDSSKGFPLWRALYHLSVCVMVNMHQRAMEWRPPSRAHAPFTLSPTLCH